MQNTHASPDWGVIFDLDGTMTPNTAYHRQAWFELCRRYNIPMTAELYHQKVHARSNDQIVPNLFGPQAGPDFIRKIEHEKETLYRQLYKPVMKPTAGLLNLLQKLRSAGIPCGTASNSPKDNVDFILDGLNVRPYFQAVFYRDHVQHGKPDPEILLKTAEALRLPPRRCILFEDSSSGFKAARAAGMPYIVITAGGDPNERKEAFDAQAVCEDFTEITPEFLRSLIQRFSAESKSA
jgi:HAD superfamily hydrolase (TIGR01509 family)